MSKRRDILLAHTVEEKYLDRFPQRFFAQRKLRGRRCRVRWVDSTPILLSSEGNIIHFMEHIQGALLGLPMLPWDGELYVHDWSQEKINGVTKRSVNRHEESWSVEYHIFDLIVDATQEQRLKGLDAFTLLFPLVQIETHTISRDQWLPMLSEFLAEGYEGIILRHPEGKYISQSPAYRSPQMLKYKPSETDTYRIVGVTEGEGWAAGMLGAFVVVGEDAKWLIDRRIAT